MGMVLAMSVVFFPGCASLESFFDSKAEYRSVFQADAKGMMERETGYVVLDVRHESAFAQAHVPGAINIPNMEIGDERPSELPDKHQLILVYGQNDKAAIEAAEKLVDLGYTNVVEFGDLDHWPWELVSGDE